MGGMRIEVMCERSPDWLQTFQSSRVLCISDVVADWSFKGCQFNLVLYAELKKKKQKSPMKRPSQI